MLACPLEDVIRVQSVGIAQNVAQWFVENDVFIVIPSLISRLLLRYVFLFLIYLISCLIHVFRLMLFALYVFHFCLSTYMSFTCALVPTCMFECVHGWCMFVEWAVSLKYIYI